MVDGTPILHSALLLTYLHQGQLREANPLGILVEGELKPHEITQNRTLDTAAPQRHQPTNQPILHKVTFVTAIPKPQVNISRPQTLIIMAMGHHLKTLPPVHYLADLCGFLLPETTLAYFNSFLFIWLKHKNCHKISWPQSKSEEASTRGFNLFICGHALLKKTYPPYHFSGFVYYRAQKSQFPVIDQKKENTVLLHRTPDCMHHSMLWQHYYLKLLQFFIFTLTTS